MNTPTIDDVLNDPVVCQELQRAWIESNPNAPKVLRGSPGSTKQEQGGWIVYNKNTGHLEVVRVPAGTRDALGTIAGTRPADNDRREILAWFHTHPNTADEGYTHATSPSDRAWQKSEAMVPGIVETHQGRQIIPYP